MVIYSPGPICLSAPEPKLVQANALRIGPVVRLTPYEVHVSDPLYADTHFSASPSARWDQYRPHEWSFGFPEATFSTVDHDIHKLRRGAFSNMFSKRKIAALEPMIVGKVRTLCARLEAIRGSTSTVDLRCVFTCLTTDIITEYALGRSYNLLATADFSPRWRSVFATGLRNVHRFKHFPFLWTIIRAVPESWVTYIDPDFKLTLDYQRDMKSKIETVVTEHAIGEKTSQPTIFHEILDSSLPAREKASSRLQQEGESVLGAGTETTSNTLNVIIFLLLTHPEKLRRVKDELRNTASLSWQELESLPYLTATIQEGLRLALGVSSRLIRVGPDRELRYREYVFPPGTPISMSVLPLHFNAAIFSDPSEFLPERWLERSNSVTRGDLFAFSKGPRMCIGIKYVAL